jgi:hypothetical protein
LTPFNRCALTTTTVLAGTSTPPAGGVSGIPNSAGPEGQTRMRQTRMRQTRMRQTRMRQTRMRQTRMRQTRMRQTRMRLNVRTWLNLDLNGIGNGNGNGKASGHGRERYYIHPPDQSLSRVL